MQMFSSIKGLYAIQVSTICMDRGFYALMYVLESIYVISISITCIYETQFSIVTLDGRPGTSVPIRAFSLAHTIGGFVHG
ncbi:hypothetical protein D3C85_465860 [compost metagenome]